MRLSLLTPVIAIGCRYIHYIQALFYDPEMTFEEFFQNGKRLNVVIAVACVIAILGVVFFSRFGTALRNILYAFDRFNRFRDEGTLFSD